ncbi:hypothetical protein GCM10009830_17320 [Glycomyces endophyticus]|uniref:Uncharacterized protein n=1 Tax=Glycomyces endophyticus TaxID=480996 RepID=A0ABN2GIE8_9ACTN
MRLLKWASPRRWSILAEGVTVVLVALVALPVLLVGGREPAPVRVVTGYLEALREGDLKRAEALVSDSYQPEADTSWLTAEVATGDWEIESVELKSATESTVHVTIASGGARAEGAFTLEGTDDDLRIANPYVYLSVAAPLFASTEVNGVRREAAAAAGAPVLIALYPGSYALFGSVPEFDGGLSLLALPGAHGGLYGGDTVDVNALLTGPVVASEALEDRVNASLAAWIDACAESAEAAPAGCPFGMAWDWGAAFDGRTEFTEVEGLDWSVEAYPRVRFGRDLALTVVEPGSVLVAGTGTALGTGEATAVDGRCTVDFRNAVPAIEDDGTVTFALFAAQQNTCY